MRLALIPGGTGALGQAVTLRLIEEGWRCIIPYRSESEAGRLRAGIAPQQRDQLMLMEADLLDPADITRVFEATEAFGTLGALVHLLGGVGSFRTVADTTLEEWDAVLSLNLRSLFLSARQAMQAFSRTGGGRIVTVAAMAALKPSATQGAYGVSKAGVVALTRILADEGRAIGVTANCIAPGIIDTPANREWGSPEAIASWTRPEQIAGAVSWLLSDAAAATNGSVLRAFGGLGL